MGSPAALATWTAGLVTRSGEETERAAEAFAALLPPDTVLALEGDLGAGKTTFVQGIARGWGSLDSVSSPTFIIVNEYRRDDSNKLFHMDAYRLDSAPEAEQLDLDTMLADGALLIEWPDRINSLIPVDNLWITYVTFITKILSRHARETG